MRGTPLLLAVLPAASHAYYNFRPDDSPTIYDTKLPTQVSIPDSQLLGQGSHSYWFAHFLTTTENTQYALISHAAPSANGQVIARMSLIDVNNPELYWQTVRTAALERNSISDGGHLSVKTTGFEISSNAQDNIATMISAGSTEHFNYNLTIYATSKAILNAGTGSYLWAGKMTTQFSFPSGRTSGTLSIGNSSYEIDGAQSLSWYDSQYGDGFANSYTWFGIQFPGSDVKASVWFSDNADPEEHLRFGTVHTGFGLVVVRFNLTVYPDEAWTSPRTNVTYQTKWLLEFDNGDFLHVQSVRKDQEIYSDKLLIASVFANVKGRFFGQESGFAMMDISPPSTA